MRFVCPRCRELQHVEEHESDVRLDACWRCGTLVPWTEADLQRFRDEGLLPPRAAAPAPQVHHELDAHGFRRRIFR